VYKSSTQWFPRIGYSPRGKDQGRSWPPQRFPMIGTELVREFVGTILLTGRIVGERPVSAFIIASPEHGKTSIVLETPFPNAIDVSDATGRGFQEILKYKPEISHIIINDMTAISAHSRNVKAYSIATINAMTEEGVRSVAFPGQVEVFPNGIRGIIACATPDLIADGRLWWNKIGLTTRILPFAYSYPGPLILSIKNAIDRHLPDGKPRTINVPTIPIHVLYGRNETEEVRKMADQKSIELKDDTGVRRLKQLHRLTMAHAILRGDWKKCTVIEEDVQFIRRIYPYISYEIQPELSAP